MSPDPSVSNLLNASRISLVMRILSASSSGRSHIRGQTARGRAPRAQREVERRALSLAPACAYQPRRSRSVLPDAEATDLEVWEHRRLGAERPAPAAGRRAARAGSARNCKFANSARAVSAALLWHVESMSSLPEVVTYTADVSICSMICRLAAVEHRIEKVRHVNVDVSAFSHPEI